jgi:transcription initiation factor IIF auxiliary subunit
MEIYLKRREIETIKNEINLGLKKLKELSSEYKQKYKQKYNLTHLTNPKRSYLDEAVLYAKLDSGPFVRIHCPECNRCNFLNIQGFLNHCRISHNIEFPSHQEANLICGKPVPDSEVPKNHPCRNTLTKPLMNPVPEKFDLDTLKRNYRGSKIIPKEGMGLGRVYGIKVYDEDVDIMEDDYPLNKVKRINPTTTITSHTPAATPSPQHITPATTSNASQSQPQSQTNVEKSTVDQVTEETVQNEGEELTQPVQIASPSAVQAPASVTCTTTQPVANYQLQHNGIPDHGSRFYIKKRIIIGNVSKYICPLDGQTSQPLFKWMVYVSGTTYDLDLTAYVRQVRFFLHPSYAPNDVIDLTAPPFHLTRYGWGEFPVRIQFFFHDDAKNNPVSFIHMLRLDWGLSGEQKLGGEIWLDLELDRNTKFLNSSNSKDQNNNEVQGAEKKDGAIPTINAPSTEDLKEKKRRKSISQKKFRPSDFGLTSEAHYSCLRQLEKYPLITSDSSLDLPYRTAKDWEEFSQWDLSRKSGIEWYRAHTMKKSILNSLDTLDIPSQTSLKQLTTRYLLNWLRYFDQSIKPLRSKINLYTHEDRRVFINFCKICGTLERLNSDFRCELQFCKNFGLLKGGLNTLTNIDNLYSQIKLHKLKTLKQIKLENSGELEEGELLDEDDDLIVIDSDNDELEVDHTNSSVDGGMELSSQGAMLLKEVSSLVYRPVQKGIQTELKQLTNMLKPLNLRLINDKPPVIVKELLLASLKVFAINLIKGSVKCSKQFRLAHKPINSGEDEDEEDEESKKHKNLLTPVHTYQFISNTQNLKFLTNENFGVSKVETKE